MEGLTNGVPPNLAISLERSSPRLLSRAATLNPSKEGVRLELDEASSFGSGVLDWRLLLDDIVD
jgi:hypothetical protein